MIVNVGTCNKEKKVSPESLVQENVSTLQDMKVNPSKAKVAFSRILNRNDNLDLELNKNVLKRNTLLEKLLLSRRHFINIDNIRY